MGQENPNWGKIDPNKGLLDKNGKYVGQADPERGFYPGWKHGEAPKQEVSAYAPSIGPGVNYLLGGQSNAPIEGDPFAFKPSDSEQNLLPGQKTLDFTTQGLISENLKRANQPMGDLENEFMQGVDAAGRPLLQTAQRTKESQHALGGPENEAMASALEKRSARNYGQTTRDLQRQSEYEAKKKRSDELAGIGSQLSKYEQLKNQLFAQKQQNIQLLQAANAEQEAGRSNFLGQALGLVGTVVGGIYGGPAGAMAGGAAGSTVGRQLS